MRTLWLVLVCCFFELATSQSIPEGSLPPYQYYTGRDGQKVTRRQSQLASFLLAFATNPTSVATTIISVGPAAANFLYAANGLTSVTKSINDVSDRVSTTETDITSLKTSASTSSTVCTQLAAVFAESAITTPLEAAAHTSTATMATTPTLASVNTALGTLATKVNAIIDGTLTC